MSAAPNTPSGGSRQQRAAQLRAEAEAQAAAAPSQVNDEAASDSGADVPAVQSQPPETPTVGQGDYVVKSGDCISSIAKDSGHFWETIWNDAANAELHEVRGEPNLLLPGDRVTIPPLRPKQEPGETELRHRFVRRGEPAALRMTLRSGGQPRANEPWTLEVDGRQFSGVTDPEGKLDVPIPGNARRAKLTVGRAGENQDVFNLALGQLDPVAALTGVQARLKNLGYAPGAADGVLGPKTRAALQRFQAEQNLPATGQPDDQTRERLKNVHGS